MSKESVLWFEEANNILQRVNSVHSRSYSARFQDHPCFLSFFFFFNERTCVYRRDIIAEVETYLSTLGAYICSMYRNGVSVK